LAINSEQTFSLDLSLFGSKVSDLHPANLPAGVSPDNSNIFYYPQGAATRPAFIHVLNQALTNDPAVMSHAPYTPPGGTYNIVTLDSDRNIWNYNVVSGAATELFTLSPWLTNNQKYFNSAQLFDKFFMAFFDPWNGLNQFSTAADIPRYINPLGHCNRVTIDGPGGGLSVENVNLENLLTPMTIESNFQRAGNIVTATLTGTLPNPLPIPGWFVQLYDKNAAIPSYNVVSSWNRTSPLASSAVQSATAGGTTPGNVIWIYYDINSGSGHSIDTGLYDAYQQAQAGGYIMYVQIANPVVGPAGVFPVVFVGGSGDIVANPSTPTNTSSRTWYYFGYQVPGAPAWQGNTDIQPSTTATYAYSSVSITPTGGTAAGDTFSGNQLYQSLDNAASLNSDGSGITRITTSVPITNLPIGAWIYLVLPSGADLPFATGWVQVASVDSNEEFSIVTPGAQIFSTGGVTLYEYWGSLNTSVNLAQPVPGNPVGTSFAQFGAQGFQITSVEIVGGNLQISWYQLGPDSTNEGSAGTYALTPQSAESPGNRQAFCFFVNEDGAPSPGSPPINFTTLGGPNFTKFTFPLGPSPTVQRALAVTPANGADFFVLPPANVQSSAAPIITPGTIIYDNTTTTGENTYIDWSDQALVAATLVSGPNAVGSDYGDLTSTINLPPCMGVIAYAEALAWIGEWNNIKNLLNMSMQGGVAALSYEVPNGPPLGWNNTTEYNDITPDGTSTLVNASDGSGWALQFTNTSGNHNGLISQGAYQDYWGAPILLPNQSYEVICRTQLVNGSGGTLHFVFYSPSQGVLASASVTPTKSILTWTSAPFSLPMPSAIPSDAVLLVYSIWSTTGVMTVADAFIVNSGSPVLTNQIRLSYPANPFGYDNDNGFVAITSEPDPIVAQFKQRKYLYALTTKNLLQTFDTGEVPAEWGLDVFAMNCGGAGPNCVDSQSDVAWWLGQHGAQVFGGSMPKKISQEIEPDIDDINWDFANIINVASDPIQRVIYFAVPVDGATISNNLITMNHRMVDPSVNITDPVHVSSYTGKMIATDLARKWSPWPVPINSLSMCYILNASSQLVQAMTFAGGLSGPTGDNAHATNLGSDLSGPSGVQSISVTPGSTSNFIMAVPNNNANTPSGWTQSNGLYYLKQNNANQVTYTTNSTGLGLPNNEWANVIASYSIGVPTPTQIQAQSLVAGVIMPGPYEVTLDGVTAGDAIIVSVSSHGSGAFGGPIIVSDNQGNKYNVYQTSQEQSGFSTAAFLAVALSVPGGNVTVTVTFPANMTSITNAWVQEFSGLLGPTSYGQIYYQDFINYPPGNPSAAAWNTTDADFGTFASDYATYFFFAHDIEQNAMLALYRKLFCYMSTHVTGTGSLTIQPYVDNVSNPWPALPALTLQLVDPGVDYEFGLNVTGNRMSLKYSMPSGGFWLTHLIVSARRDLVFPVGGVL
jgi:hypothetical protein